ncbi:MAG TPA: SDR family NAD(P)-dependent oxidoreductase, partial [Verrucomicrobiae bacterium]|nr:SDR family NAD(P)-dependent oxidoreductase [Verrucomicrobiae bacterium]
WCQLLGREGFDAALALPQHAGVGIETEDQALLLARAGSSASGSTPAASPQGNRSWLILADSGGTGRKLAERLRATGDRCTLVFPPGKELEDGHTMSSTSSAEFNSLLAGAADQSPLHGVIDLWPLDILPSFTPTDASSQPHEQHCAGALQLLQGLTRLAGTKPPQLWLCTRGARQVEGTENVLSPLAATVWGLGKVIALEHPELRCVRVDLDPHAQGDEIELLAATLDRADSEDELALRGGRRLGARLKRVVPNMGANRESERGHAPQATHLTIANRGSLDNLRIEPIVRRAPQHGEVEIRVRATALNFRDVLNVLGLYPGDPGPLGAECAGEIVAVGPGVQNLAVGDAVIALANDCFASHVITLAEWVVRKPAELTYEAAAAIPVAFMTARYTLEHLAHLQPGERVLIHAAAGGVGLAAVTLAKRIGAEIYATAGSPEKRDFLKALGVAHVLDSRSLGFAEELLRLTHGKGVQVVLNSLSDQFVERSFEVIADGGRFLEIGKRGIWDPERVRRLDRGIQYFIVDWGMEARKDPLFFGGMLRQLIAEFARGELTPVTHRSFGFDEFRQAFRTMAQGRHQGKLVLSQAATSRANAVPAGPDVVHRDATYLITGGLRGLGFLTAEWLVERGATHLVLTGRSEPSQEVSGRIRAMEALGVRVRVARVDVSDAQAMDRLLTDVRTTMPPLRGVFHSAGVLADGALVQQTGDRFARVFSPKVTGSWILHQLTAADQLDLFVMFSSIASVFGSPGQGNHAAANAFMDTLAALRKAQGLPGLSVNWGAWSGVGAAVEHGVAQRAEEMGYGVIDPRSGFKALEMLLVQERPQVAVLPADWTRFTRNFSRDGAVWPFLAEVAQTIPGKLPSDRSKGDAIATSASTATGPAPGLNTNEGSLKDQLASCAPNQRRALVVQQLRRDAARVLGIDDPESLSDKTPLHEVGLDSLMAVELRNTIGTTIGQSLPATLLFDYPTVEALTNYLCGSVLGFEESRNPSEASFASARRGTDVLDEVENLDDAEIDRLLKEKGVTNL